MNDAELGRRFRRAVLDRRDLPTPTALDSVRVLWPLVGELIDEARADYVPLPGHVWTRSPSVCARCLTPRVARDDVVYGPGYVDACRCSA